MLPQVTNVTLLSQDVATGTTVFGWDSVGHADHYDLFVDGKQVGTTNQNTASVVLPPGDHAFGVAPRADPTDPTTLDFTVPVPPPPPRGYAFALIENTSNPVATVAALPAHVDCSWVFHWRDLQALTTGPINWAPVDAALAAGAAAGKRNMVRINCGATSPSDIPTVAITYTNAAGQTQTQQIPRLWASSYTTPLRAFIAAYGARYANDPRLFVVQMPGCGRIGELAMGTPLAGTPTWQSYGYTDALLAAAWESVIGTYENAFPTGYLAWDMSAEPFHGANVLNTLIAYLSTLPTRVMVQGNGLKAGGGIAKAVTQSVGHRPVGSQAFLPVSKGGATVPQCIAEAETVPLDYMELYAQDCTAAVDAAIAAWAAAAPGI